MLKQNLRKTHWAINLTYVLLGVPLIFYPFVFIANVMQLAAIERILANSSVWEAIFMLLFLALTTIYPIVWSGAGIMIYRKKKPDWILGMLFYAFIVFSIVYIVFSIYDK